MQNKEYIDEFFNHLLKEFSPENLLAVIELEQYRNYCINKLDENNELNIKNKYSIPSSLPKSFIVYDDNSINKKYQLLCEKYILNDAEYCLNISYECRLNLIKIYQKSKIESINKMDNKDIICVFDETIKSMVILMQDSLTRWRKTQEFKSLESVSLTM